MTYFDGYYRRSFVVMNFSDPEYIKAWGENLRKIRKQKKLTALDIAVAVGTDDKHIRRIENGEVNTSLAMIRAISISLDIPPSDLFNF